VLGAPPAGLTHGGSHVRHRLDCETSTSGSPAQQRVRSAIKTGRSTAAPV
jgi:hypothetical protein